MDFKYPYTDFHELNLDWFLARFKELVEEWNQVESDWNSLHDYVQNYFDNLNVQNEIDHKLDALVADGTLATIMEPYIDLALPSVVDDKLPDVVANQIGAVVASQISLVVANQLPDAVSGEVSEWLSEHVDPDSGYVIDKTLTISNAAADAKIVGDNIAFINNDLYNANNIKIAFEQGTITTAGNPDTSNIRIRSVKKLNGKVKRYKISANAGYKYNICYFSSDSWGSLVSRSGFGTDARITDIGNYILILIGKSDDSDISYTEASDAINIISYDAKTDILDHAQGWDSVSLNCAETIPYAVNATNEYINANSGAGVINTSFSNTKFIDVSEYDYIIYSRLTLPSLTSYGGIAYYSAADVNTYVSGEVGLLGYDDFGYIEQISKIPYGVKYVRLSIRHDLDGFFLKGIKRKPLKDLKMSLLGASVEAYEGYIPEGNDAYYHGNNSGVKSVDEMWWKVLCNNTGMTPLVIDAWSGSSICYNYATDPAHSDINKIPMSSDLRTGRLASDGEDPDVILLVGGTNDWTYAAATTTPLGDWNGRTAVDRADVLSGQSTFMESYASTIDQLHHNYPSAVVVAVSLFYTWRGTDLGCTKVNNMGMTESDYNDAIKKVCDIMAIPYINIYDIGFNNYNYYPTYAVDYPTTATHPNALGHAVIAKRMIEELPKLIKPLK